MIMKKYLFFIILLSQSFFIQKTVNTISRINHQVVSIQNNCNLSFDIIICNENGSPFEVDDNGDALSYTINAASQSDVVIPYRRPYKIYLIQIGKV